MAKLKTGRALSFHTIESFLSEPGIHPSLIKGLLLHQLRNMFVLIKTRSCVLHRVSNTEGQSCTERASWRLCLRGGMLEQAGAIFQEHGT